MAQARSVFQAPLDGVKIAEGVARDVERVIGERLRRVLLYGSWARGEGRVDSDVDILVVVTEVHEQDNRLRGNLSEIAGDWFDHGGRVVSIRAVTEGELVEATAARWPTARDMFLRTVASEARVVLDVAA